MERHLTNKGETPSVSIVVPTCNRPENLSVCLTSLIRQLPDDGSVEILVCDDGRTLTTRDMLAREFSRVNWYKGPGIGPAANRNLGAREARGRWLIFIDDDCIPRTAWLPTYLAYIGKNLDSPSLLEGPTYCPAGVPSLLWESPQNPNGGTLPSCNFAVERSLFFTIGCFDERYFPAFEDIEFFSRAKACNAPIQFLLEAAVDHAPRPVSSPGKLAARWEVRVIYAHDHGASRLRILINLPWHALRVIQSRFRGKSFSADNMRAALLFACEWLLVCWQTPAWVRKHAGQPRREFWVRHVAAYGPTPKFGF